MADRNCYPSHRARLRIRPARSAYNQHWSHAPKDGAGWPLWLPRLQPTDFVGSLDLLDWIIRVGIVWRYPGGRKKGPSVYFLVNQMCGGPINEWCRLHTASQQAAMWRRLCRELGYTEIDYVWTTAD